MLPENVLRYIFQSVAIIIEFHSFPIISNILYNINQILKFLLIGNLFQPYFQNILKIISIKMLYCQKKKKYLHHLKGNIFSEVFNNLLHKIKDQFKFFPRKSVKTSC